jgi:hypothetical protein
MSLPFVSKEIPLENCSIANLIELFCVQVPKDDATELDTDALATCMAVCKELRDRGRAKRNLSWLHYSQILTFDLQDSINRVQANRANSPILRPS